MFTTLALIAAVSLPPVMSDAQHTTPGVTPSFRMRMPAYQPPLPKRPDRRDYKKESEKDNLKANIEWKRALRTWRGDCVEAERDYQEVWHRAANEALAAAYFNWVNAYQRNR